MAVIVANSQDLGRACTVDLYQTYTPPHEDYLENVSYDMDAVVRGMAEAVAAELPHYTPAITGVKVIETGSPKYYNYSTDWADYEIEYDAEAVGRWCDAHPKEWSDWLDGWRDNIDWLDDDDPRKAHRMELARLGCYINHQPDINAMVDGMYEISFEVYADNIEC